MLKNRRNLIIFLSLTVFAVIAISSIITYVIFKDMPELSMILLLTSSLFLLVPMIILIFDSPTEKVDNYRQTLNQVPDFINELEQNLNSGFIIYDKNNKIKFVSNSLAQNFKNLIGEKLDVIEVNSSLDESIQKIFKRDYLIKNNKVKRHLTFIDITREKILEQQLVKSKSALILINTFFSSKIKSNEIEKLKIQLNLNNYFENWIKKYDAVFRSETSTSDTNVIIVNWDISKKNILSGKFIEGIIKIIGDYSSEISISIGISIGSKNYNLMNNDAIKALELSKNRGGNQIVVIDENKEVKIIGKSSQQYRDTSRVEIKLFYDKFVAQIPKMGNIFITSHKNADIDALASSLAIAYLIKSFNALDVKIILSDLDDTTKKAFDSLDDNHKQFFIDEKEALKLLTKTSTVIVLDVSSIERTQASKLIKKVSIQNRYLIDHHRLSSENLEFAYEKAYINIKVSSVSEIISDMIMFRTDEGINVGTEYIYDLLISGIYIDTNNLTRNTSQTTYDSLSFLIRQGAQANKAFEYSKKKLSYLKILSEIFNSLIILGNNVIYATLPENFQASEVEISFISDLFLNFENIEASFVFAKTTENNFKLSARSIDNFNVQIVCEKLGGGGHFGSAAVTWDKKQIKYKNLKKQIRDEIVKTYTLKDNNF